MALQKQPIPINFGQGLDTKTDDKQVQAGRFLALQNSVFDKLGRLTKRNGFGNITILPNDLQTTLTTLNDNLVATGSNLYAYSPDIKQWLNKGIIQPVSLSVQSMVRVSTSQSSPDAAVAASGLTCLAYVDNGAAYYQVSDSSTGQQVVSRVALPSTSTNPRVFLLGNYFVITFMMTVSAVAHLRYIAVPTNNPAMPTTVTDIDTTVVSLTTGYDGVVANNNLYLGWSGSSSTIRLRYLTSNLTVSSLTTIASHTASIMSLAADTSGSTAVIWVSFWDSSSTNAYTANFNQNFVAILAPTTLATGVTLNAITSVATAGLATILYETLNHYNDTGSDPSTARTDFVSKVTCTQAGTVVGPAVLLRSVGLASKAFIDPTSGSIYTLVVYGETNQPTYFLIDSLGNIYTRVAYSNGGGYEASQVLPTVSSLNGVYLVPYQIKDFLASVNKGTDLPQGTPTNGIYTQTGINLGKFSINTSGQYSSEIAGALHLTGGQLWEYDGVRPVEHGFHVYPENAAFTTATTGGHLSAQIYYYVFTYEWTDNAGNLHRSASSIPLLVDLTGAGTSTSVNTLYVPTLRLTYKTSPNPVRIVGYRWSTAQQVYYQFTSLTSPAINNTTVDYVTITDSLADASILGNVLLYTTGGVIENIAAPASIASALFKNRLFLIDAEDPNLLWYSKQVIEATPVEMSDLLTLYVAPTSGVQGSTGAMTALSAMDDKLIIFKKDAIYYLTGIGPDNTGAQNDFTDPVYITSTVGCANPNSIVLTPGGLIFQSDKGLWLLGRDLGLQYIGAPVEQFNARTVASAQVIPGTNQVRFILAGSKTTLIYDYYVNQWGTFNNISAISSTLYQDLQTYLNVDGLVFQETPGLYLDGSIPVLLSFTTSWIGLAGIQGLERFYFLNLLGSYFSPFKLSVQLSYDYNPSPDQAVMVTPDNYTPAWGGEANWGAGAGWGGNGSIFPARVFPSKQKCQSFQVTVMEIYDPSFGVVAGQGFTLSGLLLTAGVKRGFRTQSAGRSFG